MYRSQEKKNHSLWQGEQWQRLWQNVPHMDKLLRQQWEELWSQIQSSPGMETLNRKLAKHTSKPSKMTTELNQYLCHPVSTASHSALHYGPATGFWTWRNSWGKWSTYICASQCCVSHKVFTNTNAVFNCSKSTRNNDLLILNRMTTAVNFSEIIMNKANTALDNGDVKP